MSTAQKLTLELRLIWLKLTHWETRFDRIFYYDDSGTYNKHLSTGRRVSRRVPCDRKMPGIARTTSQYDRRWLLKSPAENHSVPSTHRTSLQLAWYTMKSVRRPAEWRQAITSIHHELGHHGCQDTFSQVAWRYQGDVMYKEVAQNVKSCEKCRRRAYEEPLHLMWSMTIWEKVGVNVVFMPESGIRVYSF